MGAPARLVEVHPIWREGLACFEALRRLGFVADDIYMSRHDDGRMMLVVESVGYALVVNLRGGGAGAGEFAKRPLGEVFAEWEVAANLWNSATDAERSVLFEASMIREYCAELVVDFLAKGLSIPATCDA